MKTYRVTKIKLDGLKGQWDAATPFDTDTNFQDGRVYRDYIKASLVDSSDAAKIEYLDYASCTLASKIWTC